jgi:hypothetical protein
MVELGWSRKVVSGATSLTRVPELQSPFTTAAWRMMIVSTKGAKFVKVIVEIPRTPVFGPNVLDLDDENVIVSLYGLLGSTASTKVARTAARSFGAERVKMMAKAAKPPPVKRANLLSVMVSF